MLYHSQKMSPVAALPASVTISWINLTGMLTGLFFTFALAYTELAYFTQALLILISTFVPIILLDITIAKVHRHVDTGIDWARPRRFNLSRIAVKLLGFAVTIMVLATFYWGLAEYHHAFYQPVWGLLKAYAALFAIIIVAYFIWLDRYLLDPRDGYWYLGQLCLGHLHPGCYSKLIEHGRVWLIKGFFLPLMFAGLVMVLRTLQISMPDFDFSNSLDLFAAAWMLIFFIDLIFVSGGYVLTLRPLNAHIRSTDSTILGWGVALICYRPFWEFVQSHFLNYNDDALSWNVWLADVPLLYTLWAIGIIILLIIYVWSTVSFGYHFSNLTHRGIVTGGPYRFTKHPAYIAKNISWWMIAVPFVSNQGWGEAIMACALLLCVNAIYYLRARSEERHLADDPVYQAYADWIEQNGLFSRIKTIIANSYRFFLTPERKFRIPGTHQSRLER